MALAGSRLHALRAATALPGPAGCDRPPTTLGRRRLDRMDVLAPLLVVGDGTPQGLGGGRVEVFPGQVCAGAPRSGSRGPVRSCPPRTARARAVPSLALPVVWARTASRTSSSSTPSSRLASSAATGPCKSFGLCRSGSPDGKVPFFCEPQELLRPGLARRVVYEGGEARPVLVEAVDPRKVCGGVRHPQGVVRSVSPRACERAKAVGVLQLQCACSRGPPSGGL